ncbi:MAG: hypothetical protein L3J09_00095 [Flavobacteriaceae bacterium]|nr:hypothetical protein [Flavobacteriaceae bacterium]
MKKTFYIISLFLLGFASCQTESIETLEVEKTKALYIGAENRSSDSEQLERSMQWMSFISGFVLKNNKLARTEIANKLILSNNKLTALELIGPNSTTPIFKTSFILRLEYYIAGVVPNPDSEYGKPEPPIVPSSANTETQKQQFITNITVNNCIELYFPNGLGKNMKEKIASTAHPLNNSNFNNGFIRHLGDTNNNGITTTETIVDENFLNSNTITIIARPFRTGGNNCAYLEYGNVNFVDFPL